MSARLSAVLIDDDARQRDRLAVLLRANGLRVVGFPPPPNRDTTAIAKVLPDIAIIDVELLKAGRSGGSYYGTSLAAALREQLPKVPIMLISSGQVGNVSLDITRDLRDTYEELVLKGDIGQDPAAFVSTVRMLVSGFGVLRRKRDLSWASLVRVLGANVREAEALQLCLLPGSEGSLGRQWGITEAARWIRAVVLQYPGIIYDDLHTAVLLGIGVRGLQRVELKRLLSSARYRGPFSGDRQLWWKERVLQIAHGYLTKAGSDDLAGTFGTVWNASHSSSVGTSRCVVSGRSGADCVCEILAAPVLRDFSLPYRHDARPAVMDEARVSFKAIKESNEFKRELVPPTSRDIVDGLQKGDDSER